MANDANSKDVLIPAQPIPAGADEFSKTVRGLLDGQPKDEATVTKALEEVKAANAETIKKQEAMLQQLDELQKAAAQLKIFSHRTGG